MKGSDQIKILQDIAQTDITYNESLCKDCENFPLKENSNRNILCPFRTIVSENTNWKSLGCKYFWK